MSGDYSRFVFDPSRDYSGVLLQQGRPLTDWDWNDQVAQIKRRQQAATLDTLGQPTVVPATTPDAFKLAFDKGKLNIARGRLYVDGLLAENHGADPLAWDTVLAEPYGSAPVPYDQQPYLPNAPALPTTGGPHLVYVDVWEREVTQFEAPDLVERALGVDTTARTQTVWQVKVLANPQGISLSCDTDPSTIPGWKALTAPSGGRLTTDTAQYGSDDPCLIPPSGGYTGLENQLYRVEIHQGGAPGTASFKWSRDNASVETRVTRFLDPQTLVVESIGKDDVLRFNDGDWIEITDDWLELTGADGDPSTPRGELHRIKTGGGVDDALRTITLDTPVTVGRFPVDGDGRPADSRHTRIRRWDQRGTVLQTDTATPTPYANLDTAGGPGAITVPSTATTKIALENGIVVSFDVDAAGGVFRSGDYWLFAARTAGAWLQPLKQAPPRGIHHHYAKIGFITLPSTAVNCPNAVPAPSEAGRCACTVCVSPQAQAADAGSIQNAIDTVVKAGGGTVCLEAGTYQLRKPLHIENAKTLRIRGQGKATSLRVGGPSIQILDSSDITLEGFEVDCTKPGVAITLGGRTDAVLQRLSVQMKGGGEKAGAVGISGSQVSLRVGKCQIQAPLGVFNAAAGGHVAEGNTIGASSLRIERNVFECQLSAVALRDLKLDASPLRFTDNVVSKCTQAGLLLSGAGATGTSVEIARNRFSVSGIGISAAIDGLRIVDNDVSGPGASASPLPGVVLPAPRAQGETPLGNCHIIGNRITGFGVAGIAVETTLAKLMIKQNQIDHCGGGISVSATAGAELLAIENNQISDIGANAAIQSTTQIFGVMVDNVQAVGIVGNSVLRIGRATTTSNFSVAAIAVTECARVQVSGNDISDVGAPERFEGVAGGVVVRAPFADVVVSCNHIRRDSSVQAADESAWYGIFVYSAARQALRQPPKGIRIPDLAALGRDAALRFMPASKSRVLATKQVPVARVALRGNQIAARGRVESAFVIGESSCDFSNNQCQRTVVSDTAPQPNVSLAAQAIVVQGNRVTGDDVEQDSIVLASTGPRSYTVLGNVTAGRIQVNTTDLGDPWEPLNGRAA